MGLKLKLDLETNLGPSKEVYSRIENINLNRTFGKVKVALTYWIDQESSKEEKHSQDRDPKNQIGTKVVYYRKLGDLGTEIDLPVVFEFDMNKPVKSMVPIYEEKKYTSEVPYVSFDSRGRRQTKYRTQEFTEMVKVGEREDIRQVLDLSIESNLVSWCYGQVTAKLGEIFPVESIENS